MGAGSASASDTFSHEWRPHGSHGGDHGALSSPPSSLYSLCAIYGRGGLCLPPSLLVRVCICILLDYRDLGCVPRDRCVASTSLVSSLLHLIINSSTDPKLYPRGKRTAVLVHFTLPCTIVCAGVERLARGERLKPSSPPKEGRASSSLSSCPWKQEAVSNHTSCSSLRHENHSPRVTSCVSPKSLVPVSQLRANAGLTAPK